MNDDEKEAEADAPSVNSTAASLLGFLHDGPRTGWDLAATADRVIGPFWSLTRSQVYRELTAMSASGLVCPGPAGRRRSRPYTITEAGRRAFARWVAEGPGEATMRLPLLLFVVLGKYVPPDQLAAVLRRQREHQVRLLAGYRDLHGALLAECPDPRLLAVLDYGISVTRTTIRWIDRLPPELVAPTDTTGCPPTSGQPT
ncbi:PadR family transcriptional regulator [Streptomyces syringium]|uniref:PadR family transcriptional regulator n=1 Tax=Streptomyces syringium TaxID=76729 RepID=UPI0033E6F556